MPSDGARQRDSETLWRGPRAVVSVAFMILLVVLAADVFGGSTVRLGGIMLALPALAAVFTRPWPVLIVAGVMLPAYVVALSVNRRLTWTDAPVALATAVVISMASVGAAALRERREKELAQSRRVTAQTQRTLLRPLPSRLGPVDISSAYLASDAESTLGGDLYACAVVDGRPRVIVGDVQGKGLSTLEVVLFLLAAFRQAARQHVALPDLPTFLDEAVRRDLARARDMVLESGDAEQEPEAGQRMRECFVTVVVVEIHGEGEEVRMVNCGHPAPLLLHEGVARELPSSRPALPVGLLSLDPAPVPVDTHRLEQGDTLLLYTDGLIEARDNAGVFYPLADRIGAWAGRPPAAMLDALQDDVREFAHLEDDVAMVTIRRSTAPPAE
ncbi:PP2C family protein-serine/threonine phosphatase [Streptomyces sp. NPDC058653]|uniref:PP2C family protein-serine/threonine phosphatase n=1 Tax=Streptomyces sp. NPDC058653 TaxID=3346576 RepID=UPI003648A1B7